MSPPAPPVRPKLLLLVTEDWYLCSHRLPVVRGAVAAAYDVVVATRVAAHGDVIREAGARLVPLGWTRRPRSPWGELRGLAELAAVYRRERPDLVHHVALKPVIYGAVAARLAGRPPVLAAVAGLGHAWSARGARARILREVVRRALRWALGGARTRVVVQNRDDQRTLVAEGMVEAERVHLIRGSGVDLERFCPTPEPTGRVRAALVSRMLWEKGPAELVRAAEMLRRDGVPIDLVLAGTPDAENPRAIPERTLREWHASGLVEWCGHVSDVAALWASTHVAVLPTTYGEGVPKSLLEAAACGRPIVATDVPGCCEVVEHEVSGLLVPAHDAEALARALARLARDPALRARLGAAARARVERDLGEQAVVDRTLGIYAELLALGPRRSA